MSDPIRLVAGDDYTPILITLTDSSTGNPYDLSAMTTSASMKLRKQGSTTVLATVSLTKPNGGADGVVKLVFPDTVLDVDAGLYEGEIEIDFDGQLMPVYDVLKFRVRAAF